MAYIIHVLSARQIAKTAWNAKAPSLGGTKVSQTLFNAHHRAELENYQFHHRGQAHSQTPGGVSGDLQNCQLDCCCGVLWKCTRVIAKTGAVRTKQALSLARADIFFHGRFCLGAINVIVSFRFDTHSLMKCWRWVTGATRSMAPKRPQTTA